MRDWSRAWVALILAAAALPYLEGLFLSPATTDAPLWIEQAALYQRDWPHGVFLERHFIGYRPVTSMTYSLDYAVGGTAPVVYRVTDLLLYLASALSVYAVGRRLLPRPAWPALLAMLLFAAHPASEEVVPFIARRSNALATGLAMLATYAFLGALRSERPLSRSNVAAAVLLALSLLSNETAYAMVVWLALVAVVLRPPERTLRQAMVHWLVPLTGAALAFAARMAVLGSVGGYGGGNRTMERFEIIMESAWSFLPVPFPPSGEQVLPLVPVLVVLGGYYGWRSLVDPWWHREARILPLLASLCLGFSLVYGISGVWFYRGAYFMAAPWALLLAACAWQTVERWRGVPRLLHLAPQLLAGVALAVASPMVRGQDRARMAERVYEHGRLVRIEALLRGADLDEPAVVYTLFSDRYQDRPNPVFRQSKSYRSRRFSYWLNVRLHDQRIESRSLGCVLVGPDESLPPGIRIDPGPDTTLLTWPASVDLRLATRDRTMGRQGGRRYYDLSRLQLPRPRTSTWMLLEDRLERFEVRDPPSDAE